MPEITLYKIDGTTAGTIALSQYIFDAPINEAVIHQALVRQMANMRRGTHSTKTRGEVRGGGRKPWRQKGTGRARHGSIRSPLWKGGGITFGPKPRDYSQKMPKQMRRLAMCGALTSKVKDEKMLALEELKMEEYKTKKFLEMLDSLNLPVNTLFIMESVDDTVKKSAANIKGVKVIATDSINIYDILKYDRLVMTRDAISKMEEVLVNG